MDWCTKNAFAVDASENIGKCVMYSTSSKCTHTANGYKANYHLDASFNSESRIGELMNSSYFNQSLTVGSITDIRTMRLLQMYEKQSHKRKVLFRNKKMSYSFLIIDILPKLKWTRS